jgi:carotenoid cleavage dioxygenase-like enzyme
MRNTALRIPNASADAPDSGDLGDMPKGLTGTLYRNGPNPQFARRDTHFHWFLDDGMAHAFGIEDGRHFAVSWPGDPA